MRTAFLVAALGLAGSAIAQMPLPPFGSTFTSTLTRGFWFQAPAGFVITGIAVPNEASQAFQVVEVIDLGAAPPPAYPGLVTGTQLFYSNNTPAASIIPCAVPIAAGTFIGILGACTSTVGSTTSYNSYTNLAGPFQSDILGIPTTITRFGTQFGIGAGGNNPCWQEAAATLSRVEVYIAPAGPGVATNTTLGAGCIRSYASLYENFAAAAAFDLASSTMSLFPSGGGYLALPGAATFVPPTAAATSVAIGDNVQQTVSLSSPFPYPGGSTSALTICSNGFVSVASTNGVAAAPAPAAMLGFPATAWGDWHDYAPTGGANGNVKFEQAGTLSIVTWLAVVDATSTTASTWQLQFDRASGVVHYVWQSMSALGNGHLVFFSPGGPNLDPGSTDLSVALPLGQVSTGTVDINPLTQSASTRPVTGTSWNLTTSNIPANGVLGVEVLGSTDPGLNDLTLLGLPGCGLRASLDLLTAYPVSGASHSYSLAIPNNIAFVGISLFTTGAVFQVPPVNAFGAITANGIQGMVGNL
jgi:hypothetical protein